MSLLHELAGSEGAPARLEPPIEPEPLLPDVHVVEQPSAHDEVRWVAADLTRRAAAGLLLADAAIVVRAPDVYSRIVAQVLDAASIPWVGRSPHTLAHSSTGRVLLGALASWEATAWVTRVAW